MGDNITNNIAIPCNKRLMKELSYEIRKVRNLNGVVEYFNTFFLVEIKRKHRTRDLAAGLRQFAIYNIPLYEMGIKRKERERTV